MRVQLADVLDEARLTADDVRELLAVVRADAEAAVAVIAAERAAGVASVPEVAADDVARGGPGLDAVRGAIRDRGCVVVRGTFDRREAEEWDREIAEYLDRNRFDELIARRSPEAAAGGSRIWGIYWSRPQVVARQHERMAVVRSFLNSVWHDSSPAPFDGTEDLGYPDRVRRRPPGVPARGLPPHIDAPSTGGWWVAENRRVFAEVLAGRPERYDPWDAAHRTGPEVESPSGCTVFRTFQGWTALSEMHPSDGVLQLVPIPSAVAFLLVDAVAAELGSSPGSSPGSSRPGSSSDGPAVDEVPRRRRLGDHELLRPALVEIPPVEPGDTVWWHGDLVHGVGAAANDRRWNDVMYIGAAPRCPRNDVYARSMLERFLAGHSPLDFPAEHLEAEFVGRAGIGDLDARGRRQFGLDGPG